MVDYQRVCTDIVTLINDNKSYEDGSIGPLLVRLAWHACGTYDAKSRTGGSDGGTMRFFPEASDGANNGLDLARALLEPIKLKYPRVSYGDLWTLAGVVAIRQMGGPEIQWKPGRVDKSSAKDCPPQGRLPDAAQGAQHLRDVFHRMGFTDRDIVALNGAHTLGRCHKERSGFIGPWTYSPTRFSNQFFVVLLKQQWTKVNKYPGGPEQFMNQSDDLMMLPTDMALLSDPKFRPLVELYAKEKDAFFKDFSSAFAKLMALGVRDQSTSALTNVCPAQGRL